MIIFHHPGKRQMQCSYICTKLLSCCSTSSCLKKRWVTSDALKSERQFRFHLLLWTTSETLFFLFSLNALAASGRALFRCNYSRFYDCTVALCAARLISCNLHGLQLTIHMQLTVCSITYPTYYAASPFYIPFRLMLSMFGVSLLPYIFALANQGKGRRQKVGIFQEHFLNKRVGDQDS